MKRLGFLGAMLSTCLFLTVVCSAIAADEDDCKRQPAKSWPTPRFADNHNGTVTDKLTGLIWLKDADCFGGRNWNAAVSLAGTLANGQCGLSDGSKAGQWRLPSCSELNGLVNHQQVKKAAWLNLQGFSKVVDNFYWSSTSSDYSDTDVWFVDMQFGGTHKITTNTDNHVWPVRSPP